MSFRAIGTAYETPFLFVFPFWPEPFVMIEPSDTGLDRIAAYFRHQFNHTGRGGGSGIGRAEKLVDLGRPSSTRVVLGAADAARLVERAFSKSMKP